MTEVFPASGLATTVFWIASAVTIGAAILVVTQRDVFRAAMALAASFIGVATIYFSLNAEFVGIVQILIYVGAISILIAFAVMFIRDIAGGSLPSRGRAFSATAAALALAAIAFTAYNVDWTSIDTLESEPDVAGLAGAFVEQGGDETGGAIVVPTGAGNEDASGGVLVDSTGPIGVLLVRDFVLPFETIGLVLVAALIGGLALMRRPPERSATSDA